MRRFAASIILAGAALWIAPVLAASPIVGTWAIASQSARGGPKREATWVITESAGAYKIDFKPNAPADGSPTVTVTASNISVNGTKLTFTGTVNQAGEKFDVNYDLTVTGEALDGTGVVAGEPENTTHVTGKKK